MSMAMPGWRITVGLDAAAPRRLEMREIAVVAEPERQPNRAASR